MSVEKRCLEDFDKLVSDIELSELWQAQVYAITLVIIDMGFLTKDEFMSILRKNFGGKFLRGSIDFKRKFFLSWLSSLETIVVDLEFIEKADLIDLQEKWRTAFLRTQHGKPVIVSNLYQNKNKKS